MRLAAGCISSLYHKKFIPPVAIPLATYYNKATIRGSIVVRCCFPMTHTVHYISSYLDEDQNMTFYS